MIDYVKKIEDIDPNFFNDLRKSNHGYNGNSNPYHLEADGNVYGHTLMVYQEFTKKAKY